MTVIRFRIGPSCSAVLVRPIVRYVDGAGVKLPQYVTVTLSSGMGTSDLTPTDGSFCYEVQEQAVGGSTRFVLVPSSVTTLDYENLQDADPVTFGTSVAAVAAWDAALAQAVYPTLTSITYNPDGSVATVTEAGVLTSYTYNTNGTVYSDSRAGVTRTYSYDGSGNLTGIASV